MAAVAFIRSLIVKFFLREIVDYSAAPVRSLHIIPPQSRQSFNHHSPVGVKFEIKCLNNFPLSRQWADRSPGWRSACRHSGEKGAVRVCPVLLGD